MTAHPLLGDIAGMDSSSSKLVTGLARALTYLVYAFVLVALVLLLLAFFMLLFGANPHAPFAEFVNRGLTRVMAPFRGLFEPVNLDGRSVLDVSVLFAMIVYGIVALLLRDLIDWLSRADSDASAETAR
jgi:uncharacterized protein YggT (Ycf19 family)